MKIGALATLPLLVQAQSQDTSTLLSLKTNLKGQLSMEAGVGNLLDAVGTRNVTQMASLLQNLVEESISEGGYDLDGDVKAALEMIKEALIGDIQSALKEAHCVDQVELHEQILCFQGCEKSKELGAESCPKYCDGSAHKDCRDGLLGKYKEHISACRALDDFMKDFEAECPKAEKKCCLLSHTTWNCGGLCAGAIAGMEVDGYFGDWLMMQVTKFENAYTEWMSLHHKCTAAYHAYVEVDAKCDCMQAECETNNCAFETCHYLNCEDNYNRCWGACEAEWKKTRETKECLEKDRKIDWSATEKIECYVDVLLAAPTKEELLSVCGTEDCFNKYRETKYKYCNTICPEVDFDTGSYSEHARRDDDNFQGEGDIDVTEEGQHSVNTMHRAADGSDADVRCTSHLDLDFQEPPCCNPCEVRPEPPCTGKGGYPAHTSYMWLHYGQYGHFDTTDIADFEAAKCHNGEHTYSYGYNLCDCLDCPPLPYVPPATCTAAKQCCASTGGQYDYSKHDIKMDCAATTVDFEGPSIKLSTGKMTSKPAADTFEDAVDASVTNAPYCSKALDTVDYSNQATCGAGRNNIAYKLEVTFQVCVPGTWHFDFNVDFGWGGVVRFDGVRSPEGYHSGDHWWSHDLNRALPLDIAHHFDAGVHTMVVYGAEGCCDGQSNVRIQKPGGSFEKLSIASLGCASVDEE